MTTDYLNLMQPWYSSMEAGEGDWPEPRADMIREQPGVQDEKEPMDMVRNATEAASRNLQKRLLAHIHCQSPQFFEHLVLDVISAARLAGTHALKSRKLGRSGDGGIDGIIDMDEFSLDAVYLQAKRLKPSSSVTSPAIRDFLGSLDVHRATKGVFVTSGNFTSQARGAAASAGKRVALVDGQRLTELMVRFNIGVRPRETFHFCEMDACYFSTKCKTG